MTKLEIGICLGQLEQLSLPAIAKAIAFAGGLIRN